MQRIEALYLIPIDAGAVHLYFSMCGSNIFFHHLTLRPLDTCPSQPPYEQSIMGMALPAVLPWPPWRTGLGFPMPRRRSPSSSS